MNKSALALLVGLLAAPAFGDITSVVTYPAGSNGDVQFKQNNRFTADTGNLTYSTSTKKLTVQGIVISTLTANGLSYTFPSSCSGGTFWRYDGSGALTCETPSLFSVAQAVGFETWDGTVLVTSPTVGIRGNADQFVISLVGGSTSYWSLNPSSVTLMGPLTPTTPITLTGNAFGIDKSSATLRGPDPALGGDLGGTVSAATVTDDSHNHTGSTISGLDISADTNLAASPPIVLVGDTITIDKSSATLLGPTIDAAELPSDGYASTYVNVTGDTMTGQLTLQSSMTVNQGVRASSAVIVDLGSLPVQSVSGRLVNAQISLSTAVVGNLPVTNLAGGSGASASTFWRGDGAWVAAGGGTSSLAITTGTVAGYVGIPSSPTALVIFDQATTKGQLVGSATYFFSLLPSSVTLQGQSVIRLVDALQSGATFYVSSGTVAGQLRAGDIITTGDLTVGDDATVTGGLLVQGGSGVTINSLTALKCVETDASGKLISSDDDCGVGVGGGSASTLAIATGTTTNFVAASSPTAAVNFSHTDFQASLTGSATAFVQLSTNVARTDRNQTWHKSQTYALALSSITLPIVKVSSMVVWADGSISTTAVAQASGGSGDITGVAVSGEGLTGGGTSGDVTITIVSTVAYTTKNQTWTGENNWTSTNPSTFTLLAMKSGAYVYEAAGPPSTALLQFKSQAGAQRNYIGSTADTFYIINPTNNEIAGFTSDGVTHSAILYDRGRLQLNEDSVDSNYVALRASETLAGNVEWTLPNADGSAGQVLHTNGAGDLYFGTDDTAVGGGDNFGDHISTMTLTANYGVVGSTFSFAGPQQSTVTYGLTVGSLTVNGAGAGEIDLTEGSSPSGITGKDVIWGDSTANWIKFNPNNTSTYTVVGTSAPITPGNCAKFSGNGSLLDAGACGSAVGGSGIVSPGTFTWTNNHGVIGSTLTLAGDPAQSAPAIKINNDVGQIDFNTTAEAFMGRVYFLTGGFAKFDNWTTGPTRFDTGGVDRLNIAYTAGTVLISTNTIVPGTTIYHDGQIATGVDVTVGGQSVCLENGTNCPASIGGSFSVSLSTGLLAGTTIPAGFELVGTTMSFSSATLTAVRIREDLAISSGNVTIVSTGTLPALKITADGTYGASAGTSGGLLVNCTGGATSSGMCSQIYSNAGAQGATGPLLYIRADNTAFNQPLLYLTQDGTPGGAANARMDGPAPQIEFVENDQATPAGKYELGVNGDLFYVAGRNSADSAFEDLFKFGRRGISGGPYMMMMTTASVRFYDSDSSNYVAIKASATVAGNVQWTLPAADGSAGQVLHTNAAGDMYWGTVSGSGDITGVAVSGEGLAGGGTTGDVTVVLGSTVAFTTKVNTFTSSQTFTSELGTKISKQLYIRDSASPGSTTILFQENDGTNFVWLGCNAGSNACYFSDGAEILVINPYDEPGGHGIALPSTGTVRFHEVGTIGDNYVALVGSNSIASDLIFRLPSADGTAGQVLHTTGEGSWYFDTDDSGGGGGSDALKSSFTYTFRPEVAHSTQTTNFCVPTRSTNSFTSYLACDASTREDALWSTTLDHFVGATIKVQVQYSMASATSGDVIWEARIMCVTPGDAQDIDTASFAAPVSATDAVPATAGYLDEVTITPTGDSCAEGDHIVLIVARDAANASDTATGDAEIRAVRLYEQ